MINEEQLHLRQAGWKIDKRNWQVIMSVKQPENGRANTDIHQKHFQQTVYIAWLITLHYWSHKNWKYPQYLLNHIVIEPASQSTYLLSLYIQQMYIQFSQEFVTVCPGECDWWKWKVFSVWQVSQSLSWWTGTGVSTNKPSKSWRVHAGWSSMCLSISVCMCA